MTENQIDTDEEGEEYRITSISKLLGKSTFEI